MKKRLFPFAITACLLGLFAENASAQASGTNPELVMYRYNSSKIISPTPVVEPDVLGTIRWKGFTGIGNIVTGASIQSTITGPVVPGAFTANMVFGTRGAAGLTNRAIITSDGLVGIGLMNPLYHLDVLGNTHTSGRFFGRIHFDVGEPTGLPDTYNDEAYFERKTRAQLGLAVNAYPNGGILSLAPGGGSLDRQLFSGGSDGLWTRSQDLVGGNSWAAWEKILTSADINGRPNLVAKFLPPGPTSSKLGDSQLFDNGTNVVVGGIAPAPAVPAPIFDPADVFTVNGKARVNGDLRSTNNLQVDVKTTTNQLAVTATATVSGHTSLVTLNASGLAVLTGLDVINNLSVSGESRLTGKVGIGVVPNLLPGGHSLYVGGSAIAEEVVVKLKPSWPDYVFENGHAVMPLSEVEKFVAEEKHLPGIASAKEVAENGLPLGAMQKAQMEKIEEIYLHLIALEKRVKQLEMEKSALETKVGQLEKQ